MTQRRANCRGKATRFCFVFTPKICMLCFITINSFLLNFLCISSCFRMLAVILVSDISDSLETPTKIQEPVFCGRLKTLRRFFAYQQVSCFCLDSERHNFTGTPLEISTHTIYNPFALVTVRRTRL